MAKNKVAQVKSEIQKAVNEIDSSRRGQLSAAECETLYRHLGWSEADLKRLFDFAGRESQKMAGGKFTSDDFIDWLFTNSQVPPGKSAAPTLGVIRLDYDYPPAPGDIDHSGSFKYDVFYRVVPGLTFDMCQAGKMTDDVEREFIEAVKFLDAKGVSGITGDCGFMMWFQALARQYTSKPVFMSSLAHLPAIRCATSDRELIAIFTANGKTLEPMRDLIRDECGVDTTSPRFVVVGCESVPGFEAVAAGERVDVVAVQPGMVAKANQVLKEYPKITAILMECTELPPYSDALRATTGLPVYDAITCCDFFIRGRLDHPQVGEEDWQQRWDGQQELYHFGQNLSEEDRALVVNKDALARSQELNKATTLKETMKRNDGMQAKVPEWMKDKCPVLGCLRIDYEYAPAVGDMANPRSFAYPVIYRVVPGLTYDMCVTGKMSEEVEEEWIAAVKYLDDRGVVGITSDLEFTMQFQELTRNYTTLPVFLSPAVQLPAITAAFNSHEQVLLMVPDKQASQSLLPLIAKECGVDPEERRFIFLDAKDVDYFYEYSYEDKGLLPKLQETLTAKILKFIGVYSNVRAILMMGTVFSPFSDSVRAICHVPVFDALTCCDLFVNGRMDNPLFGLAGWQKVFDGSYSKYKLGDNVYKDSKNEGPRFDSVGNECKIEVGG